MNISVYNVNKTRLRLDHIFGQIISYLTKIICFHLKNNFKMFVKDNLESVMFSKKITDIVLIQTCSNNCVVILVSGEKFVAH